VTLVAPLIRRLLRESPAFNMAHLHVVCAGLGVDYNGWSLKGREALVKSVMDLICHGSPDAMPAGTEATFEAEDFEDLFMSQPLPSVRVDWLLLVIVRAVFREQARLVEALKVVSAAADEDTIDDIARESTEVLNSAMAGINWSDTDRERVLQRVEQAVSDADAQCKKQHGASRLAREAAVVAHRETLKGVVELWLDASAKGRGATEEALAELAETAHELDARTVELQEQAEEHDAILSSLEEARFQLGVLEQEHARVCDAKASLEESLGAATDSHEAAALRAAELEARMSSAITDLDRTRAAAATAEGDAAAAKTQAAEAAERATKAATEAASARSEAAKAASEKDLMESASGQAKEAASAARKGAAAARARTFMFGARMQAAKSKAAAAADASSSLASDLLQARREVLEQKAAAEALSKRLETEQASSVVLRRKLAQEKAASSKLRDTVTELQAAGASSAAALLLSKSQMSKLEEKLARQAQVLQAAQQDLAELRAAASVSGVRRGSSVASSSVGRLRPFGSFSLPVPPTDAVSSSETAKAAITEDAVPPDSSAAATSARNRPPRAEASASRRAQLLLAKRLRAAVSATAAFRPRRTTAGSVSESVRSTEHALESPAPEAPDFATQQAPDCTTREAQNFKPDVSDAAAMRALDPIEAPPTPTVFVDGGFALSRQAAAELPNVADSQTGVSTVAAADMSNSGDDQDHAQVPPDPASGAIGDELCVADALLSEIVRADRSTRNE
jgi:hypothetical protein